MDELPNVSRKGARRRSEVPPEVLAALNRGEIATVNLVEWLALDQRQLVRHVLPLVGLAKVAPGLIAALDAEPKPSAMQYLRVIGRELAALIKPAASSRSAFAKLAGHRSDVVRSWAAFVVAYRPDLSLEARLSPIRPLAADAHFGVREAAWMAVRPAIAAELEPAIPLLSAWSSDGDANLRRFASEVTRPRGVWCSHLTRLKVEPQLALPILEPLRSDDSKYVRDSVGNWLNDASKSQPDWVRRLTRRWQRESKTPETAYIVKRALRTIGASNGPG
jgi:3-methyladenine DNA glycosylase AlkC